MLGYNMNMRQHIREVVRKIDKAIAAVARLISNKDVPKAANKG